MDISIDQARALCATVDEGSYSKASEKLNKSHSALIYLIKTLETQCDLVLFDRRAYRNTLTPMGKRVYLKCHEILLQVDELSQLCSQLKAGWEPGLRIVYDGSLPFEPFIKIHRHFRAKKITTVVQTYANYLEGVEETFKAMNADIMISIMPVDQKGLDFINLKKQESFLVAHKDHLIHKSKNRWSLEDLQQFNFLTIRGSGKKLGLNTFELEESASFFFSDFQVKKEAILKGSGFGWLPAHLIGSELKNKKLLPVRWERPAQHTAQPVLYFNKKKYLPPATQIILDYFSS